MEANLSLIVETEFTPNPNSLKFNINKILTEKDGVYFPDPAAAEGIGWALRIFDVPGVQNIYVGKNFLTISRSAEIKSWAKIAPAVTRILEEDIPGFEGEVDLKASAHPEKDSEVVTRIKNVLDEKVRPAVARDGGDIVFQGFQNGVVTVFLRGACAACPSSIATLKMGVERLLKEFIPEVKEVVQI